MSYNNSYDSGSYQRPYSSQGSSPWPMGIEPFSRSQQNTASPMQDYGYNAGGYNNNRPLLPSPSDGGGRGGMQFDYGHGSRPTVMSMSNGPSRDDVYMPDVGRSSDNYRESWDRYDDIGHSHTPSSMPWKGSSHSLNGQGSQYSSPQNYQSSFNSSYNERMPRNEDNRSRRSYPEPVRSRSFRDGPSDYSSIRRTIRPLQNKYANTNVKSKTAKPGTVKNVPQPTKKGPYFCKVCNLTFVPYSALIAHNKTSDHNRQKQLHQNMLKKLAAAKAAGQDPEAVRLKLEAAKDKKPAAKSKKEALSYCTICKTKFSGSSIDHLASDKHKLHKAMDRPYCVQCQRFFRTPTLFVKHCNSEAHKKAGNKKEGDNAIDAEFFTLDAVGCYDSEQGKGVGSATAKPKKKKKMTSLNKITISLPAGSVSQDTAGVGSGDIPVVSITQENGVETKSVSMKPAGETKANLDNESSDEDMTDVKPVGLAFVVPITGFYCQICEQFFKDENVARNDHCLSKAHRKKYKDATVEDCVEDADADADADAVAAAEEFFEKDDKMEDSTSNGENGEPAEFVEDEAKVAVDAP